MKKSFIFCYRNREEHLNITIPRIRKDFCQDSDEIIIVEQNDTEKFRRANLLNIGAKASTGDVLIFHDIDYYPVDVVYYRTGLDVFLPVYRAEFVYNDLTPKPLDDVPKGYRHFKDGVDEDFFGAVTTFKRDAFFKIGGFSTKYVGWGFEDMDLRNRVYGHNLLTMRGNSKFYALDHLDSGPDGNDPDFFANMQRAYNFNMNYVDGVYSETADTVEVFPFHPYVDKWIMATNFNKPKYIMGSVF